MGTFDGAFFVQPLYKNKRRFLFCAGCQCDCLHENEAIVAV